MRQTSMLLILVLCFAAAGCSKTYFPLYVTEMTVSRPGEDGPVVVSEPGLLTTRQTFEEDTALVEDDLVRINAAIRSHHILIGLISKADQPLDVIWAEATITHRGITEQLVLPAGSEGRGDPHFFERSLAPATIEPGGQISVQAAPRSSYSFIFTGRAPEGTWSCRNRTLFDVGRLTGKQSKSHRAVAVERAVGEQVEILLPIETPEGRIDYTIHLTVHSAEVGHYTHYIM